MSSSLSGKKAMITGAGSGLGQTIANVFARAGAHVVCTDRDEAGLKQTAAQLSAEGYECTVVVHDVTQEASWSHAIAKAFDDAPCDILVNNAGIVRFASLTSMSLDDFQAVCNVNILSPFAGTKLFVEALRKAADGAPAKGSIVNLTSVAVRHTFPGWAAYSSSKAALGNLTKALAVELGLKGDFIRVNAVAPGPVRTAMTEAVSETPWEERDHTILDGIPLHRYGEKEEVAKAALYLASDRAKFVTGYTLPVDGGWGDK